MLVPTGFTWMNPNCETSVRHIWAVGLRFHSLSTHTTNRFYRPSHGAPVSPNLVTGSNLSCTGLLRLGVTKPSFVCVDSGGNLNPTAPILQTDVWRLGYIHGKPIRGTLCVACLILAEKNADYFVPKFVFLDYFFHRRNFSPKTWGRALTWAYEHICRRPCWSGDSGYSVSLLKQHVLPGASFRNWISR